MSEPATAEATPETKGKPAANSSSKRKMRFKHKFLLIVFSLLMMAVLRTGFVFFVIGMLPAIVAYYMDITKHHYTFKSICAANMSGMMPYITQIMQTGPSSTLLQTIMGSGTTWITIYGAAFLGWLLVMVCPIVAQTMVSGMHQTQHMRFEWLQKLENEWGDEVKQFSGDPHDHR